MKKLLVLCLTALCYLFSGCNDTIYTTVEYLVNEPVLMTKSEFINTVNVTNEPREITEQGKICFYNGYLYISQPGEGIHIIDNQNPSRPKAVGFIELLGNADMIVRNDKLFADALVDLIWFDITDPAKPVLSGRIENVFEMALPLIDNEYTYDYGMCYNGVISQENVVVGWNLVKRVEKVEEYSGGDVYYEYSSNQSGGKTNNGGGMSNSVNGSMSRFGLYDNYLYTVINNYLGVFEISGSEPVQVGDHIHVGMDVETIFPYKDCLFMGTPFGMMIYSVANPLAPERMSTISHVFGCDPVVVENDIAYVTIHAGNFCGQNNNELIIIDVSDVKSPKHIVSYAMTKPKGLGIDNGTLFVCDNGLQVFNAEDPQTIMANRLVHYDGMDGFDVIPYNNVLMMIAEDGLYQYDYSNLKAISLLSKLTYKK